MEEVFLALDPVFLRPKREEDDDEDQGEEDEEEEEEEEEVFILSQISVCKTGDAEPGLSTVCGLELFRVEGLGMRVKRGDAELELRNGNEIDELDVPLWRQGSCSKRLNQRF